MPIAVRMPKLGESVEEGTISRWLKAEGDAIKELEPLLEVNTDKVDTEIPSPASGVILRLEAELGSVAKAGDVIAWIGEPGEQPASGGTNGQAAKSEPPPAETAPAPGSATTAKPGETVRMGRHPELGFISPVVARLASQHNLDLSQISGTGQGGRITKQDVLGYIDATPQTPAAPVSAPVSAQPKPAPSQPAPAPSAMPGELIPHSGIRKSIAEHMVMSKRTSPHVTTVMEVDLSKVSQHRNANKAAFERDGSRLTFTVYFVAATVAALRAYPNVNSSWTDEGLQLHRQINIGMATSLGADGLIVPVIRDAASLSLTGIARSVNDLAERARARQLRPDEVRGGTFTITNHGISGSLFATPIINQPQCGILGVGAIQKRPVVITDQGLGDVIAIRPMVYISLTFDHRILDGAAGDAFLAKVVTTLQDWPANA